MRADAFSGAWLALVSRVEESGMESVKKSQWRKSHPFKPKGPCRVNSAPLEIPSAPPEREAEGF